MNHFSPRSVGAAELDDPAMNGMSYLSAIWLAGFVPVVPSQAGELAERMREVVERATAAVSASEVVGAA
jgi:hypothetical protein